MRYQVGQELFAVHFGYKSGSPHAYGLFSLPLFFDNVVPDVINFTKLTVTEHYKVHNAHETDTAKDPDCDGYLLKSDSDTVFSNQYPVASYGQVSDTGDRRFRLKLTEEQAPNGYRALRDSNPETIFEYHLLSDVLETMVRGIKELGDVMPSEERSERAREKLELLDPLYERVIKEFKEKYPDQQLNIDWETLIEGSELLWPKVTFRKAA